MFNETGQMDDGTVNLLVLFVSVMFGVNGAVAAVAQISKVAAPKVANSLAKRF